MSTRRIEDLVAIMARLRDPETGCPWDREQDFDSIAPYTIEEAYEVADAIDRKVWPDLCEELGDLLLQVVFHSRMAQEQGLFGFDDVVTSICEKMVVRHPHVFGDAEIRDAAAQTAAWETQKAAERAARGDVDESALAGIPAGLPEWMRALKLQKRAARVGFDWPSPHDVLDKLSEEVAEVRAEFDAGADKARLTDEIGDVLFVCVNLARHAGIDFSTALRGANAKFERRFRAMEAIARGRGHASLAEVPFDGQESLWSEVKRG